MAAIVAGMVILPALQAHARMIGDMPIPRDKSCREREAALEQAPRKSKEVERWVVTFPEPLYAEISWDCNDGADDAASTEQEVFHSKDKMFRIIVENAMTLDGGPQTNSPKWLLATELKDIRNGGKGYKVTYSATVGDGFVISGNEPGGAIFYRRTWLCGEGAVGTLTAEYSAALSLKYDKWIEGVRPVCKKRPS